MPKTCATWADAPQLAIGLVSRLAQGGRCRAGRGCDDLRLVGLKLIFLFVSRAVSHPQVVAAAGVVEGRRDPYAALSALGRLARAAAGSFAADVAGPCVAGAAGRDAADRAPRRDAAHRHPRHHRAMASRHRPPPLGTPVAPWPAWAPACAPQRPVGSAAAGARARVMGVPPYSRRACRARHHDGTVDGMADPRAPGSTRLRAGMGRAGPSSCDRRQKGSWRSTSFPPISSTAQGVCPGRDRAWHASRPGPWRYRAPVQSWVVQQARNLLMNLEDAGTRAKFVLHDRDASFTAAFDEIFRAAGARIARSAVQAPRMNSAWRHRFFGTYRVNSHTTWRVRQLMRRCEGNRRGRRSAAQAADGPVPHMTPPGYDGSA